MFLDHQPVPFVFPQGVDDSFLKHSAFAPNQYYPRAVRTEEMINLPTNGLLDSEIMLPPKLPCTGKKTLTAGNCTEVYRTTSGVFARSC